MLADPRPVQPARSVKDAAHRLRRCRRSCGGILNCRCAQCFADGRSGRRDGPIPIEQYYHTRADTPNKVNFRWLGQIGSGFRTVIADVAKDRSGVCHVWS